LQNHRLTIGLIEKDVNFVEENEEEIRRQLVESIYVCCNSIYYVLYFQLVCLVISICIMYFISSFNAICFLKFIVHKINSEMGLNL
jgi:hypothetical protein